MGESIQKDSKKTGDSCFISRILSSNGFFFLLLT